VQLRLEPLLHERSTRRDAISSRLLRLRDCLARQNERDYKALVQAAQQGRIEVHGELVYRLAR
jgi:hypothetical protein